MRDYLSVVLSSCNNPEQNSAKCKEKQDCCDSALEVKLLGLAI